MYKIILLFLALLCAANIANGFGMGGKPMLRSLRSLTRGRGMALAMEDGGGSSGGGKEETDDEMRERLRKTALKRMFNENGVAYAPWAMQTIDEDAIIEDLMRKEKGEVGKFKPAKTSILDRGEIEAAEGMRWRMQGNQVDLAWGTGGETDNQGFIIEKRPSYGGDFQEIASFREVSQLASKGNQGGRYRYTDPSSAGGSWIYRVQDCDSTGKSNVLCQCFVEVQTETEGKQQQVVAIAFGALLIAASAVGYALNPPLDY